MSKKNLSIEEKRAILKKIAAGNVKSEDLLNDDISCEMWTEDENDAGYMKMFYPHQNQRMRKEEYEKRASLTKQCRVTINIF